MSVKCLTYYLNNTHHQLSKQEICDALWPKKPDASETLYTLIRRIKPVIEQNSNLMIESERGKSYSKQEICDALWPKKPDASETLYTLIRRIKPVIEQNSNLMIESERGKSYRLIIR